MYISVLDISDDYVLLELANTLLGHNIRNNDVMINKAIDGFMVDSWADAVSDEDHNILAISIGDSARIGFSLQ